MGRRFGNIAWQLTKFPPELLDRLAAWQHDFDHNYHHDTGWRSAAARYPAGPTTPTTWQQTCKQH